MVLVTRRSKGWLSISEGKNKLVAVWWSRIYKALGLIVARQVYCSPQEMGSHHLPTTNFRTGLATG